ncbi:hypothetical protein R5R35_004150 [Gryllus longicercus]|uniref:Uncharacterized protein n=1 Tax=Gryllus longicercus TaxID=2509291 RepID=A0AAN9YX97_9ORTH
MRGTCVSYASIQTQKRVAFAEVAFRCSQFPLISESATLGRLARNHLRTERYSSALSSLLFLCGALVNVYFSRAGNHKARGTTSLPLFLPTPSRPFDLLRNFGEITVSS